MTSESVDPIKARLQQSLQMDDLGTRRREFISTDTIRDKYSRIKIDQIDANRASNQAGSEVQRLAEANKVQLNSWANAWKTIGGDVDLEELDPLMNGQSHRARLADQVMSYGGQSYGEGDAKKSNTKSSSRGARGGGGRGGGVMGTRGRASNTAPAGPRSTDPQRIKRVPDLKLGNHAVTPPPTQPKRRLDPALEPEPKVYQTRSRSRRDQADPPQEEKKNQQPNKKDNRPNKAPTNRRPVTQAGPSSFEHLLAPTTDFLAAISAISGKASAPSAAPPYNENSTFFSQGSDKPTKPKKVEESSKKTPNKETPKKGQAPKKKNTPKNEITPNSENTPKSDNAPKKGPASKTPKKRPTPKQKQKQTVPAAPKANDKKPSPLPHAPKGETKLENAPPPQLPEGEIKGTALPIAGPAHEKPIKVQESPAIEATTFNILDSEVPQTANSAEADVGFQAGSSFASSLPQPADEPTPEEDAAADDLPDLLLDFSTPPSAKRKNKAPVKQSGPAMGELVDISSRPEEDVFMQDDQASRTYQGTFEAASLSTYPNFVVENPEMLAKQQELDQIKRLLSQEINPDLCSYLNYRKGILEAQLEGMKKDYVADEATESKPPVVEDNKKQNAQAEALVDTSVPKVHSATSVPHPQQESSGRAHISGLKFLNLIGTHNLPGRSRNMESGSVYEPPKQEPAKQKGHERKSTILSQASSTGTSESRMRSKRYIPYSAVAMQYAPEYFQELEEEKKRIEELKNGVSALTLDSPQDATFSRPVSPSPAPAAPKPEVASKPTEPRNAPYFPDTAATRQYSGNFGNGPSASSNLGEPKNRGLTSGEQARRTASTDSKASSQPSKLTPTVAPFQPSRIKNSAKPSAAPSISNTPKPGGNEQKAEQGLGASKYTGPSKPRAASGLYASKYAVPENSEVEQKATPPRYAYSPQRAPSQGLEASKYAQSPKRKASQGLEASRYAQAPKRAANQGLEASRYASPARSTSGQGLETSKYASTPNPKPAQGLYASKYSSPPNLQPAQGPSASNPKPAQGLYASKYASPPHTQPTQEPSASRNASASNPKPAQGLYASKYAPQGGEGAESGKSQGLEDFKQGSWPHSRGHQRK